MENELEKKVCGSCGSEFGCGAKLEGCWCTELTLKQTQAEAIMSKFADCLCPQCLAMYSSKPGMTITYPNGSTEIIPDAVRVDTQNFHEGMFDFYDKSGALLTQIDMGSGIKWDIIGENEK